MALSQSYITQITELKESFDRNKAGKESLLAMIDEAELSEGIYNSNAIENSTVTLPETEKILLSLNVSRNISLREMFEVKNLAAATDYAKKRASLEDITQMHVLLLHKILMTHIDDAIAGRFRGEGEYVRIGSYIAPAPDRIEEFLQDMFIKYTSDFEQYFLEKISQFHLEFETIHPFNDGNGCVGRLIINWQLQRLGFPPIILRDKEKETYYKAFYEYRKGKTTIMDRFIALALIESLHKRNAYLQDHTIMTVTEYASFVQKPLTTLLNAAKRQTIPAFREKGVWKIGIDENE